MALATQFYDDIFVQGTIFCTAFDIPAGTVVNAGVSNAAAIAASKLQQRPVAQFSQNGSATAYTRVAHIVRGLTGTIKLFDVTVLGVATGAANAVLDLHLNGVSVLNSAITIDSSDAAYTISEGLIDTTAVVHDDVLEVVQTISEPGTDTVPTGVAWRLDIDEAYPA